MRVACYIDGFNLYHAIDDLQKPHLKWVDLSRLAQSFCRSNETLVKTVYFSAYATWLPSSYARHRTYVSALKQSGVICNIARFSEQNQECKKCKAQWKHHEEKETDVHFSLTLLEDALDNVFDRVIIVSADSDHCPAARRVRSRFPAKQVFVATPPNRHGAARELLKVANSNSPITPGRLARCLFPEKIIDATGALIERPIRYAPPPGWLPPT